MSHTDQQMESIRVLELQDEPALERFLRSDPDVSMILRSNLRTAGIVDRGEPFQGTYVAGFDRAGEIVGVIARYWNGNWICLAPVEPARLARGAAALTHRPINGLLGPWDQTQAIRSALGLETAPTQTCGCDDLYALPLAELIVPPALASGQVQCRHSRDDELDLLSAWRLQFNIESIGGRDDEETRQICRGHVERWHAGNVLWVLETEGQPVAMSGFNATLPDCVQIGSVWTRPELRRRGYARCAVAGTLREARENGVTRSILFVESPHARRAYEAIGFRRIGDYGLVLFDGPQAISF